MTPEEAIDLIESQNILDKEYDLDAEAIKTACDALGKQVSRKVVNKCHGMYVCPDCGSDVVGSGNFCWSCGQKLNWGKKK